MERHLAKRLRVPCAVISGPVHVQDFPARYSPQMGCEGANVLFDAFVHPLMMGLEEHLIGMFRGDFEFHADAAPSHLGSHGGAAAAPAVADADAAVADAAAVDPAVAAPPETVHADAASSGKTSQARDAAPAAAPTPVGWAPDAERELHKIPFFVRGKARRNTERYASERGMPTITVETLYDAKAHFAR